MMTIIEAIEVAYNHGYNPTAKNEYEDILQVLDHEPTQEEAVLLREARSEGFKKRVSERLTSCFNTRVT